MSARDDYPPSALPLLQPGIADVNRQLNAMCDEIDRHRNQAADVAKAIRDVNGMNDALSELIRELTAHADAMRDLLANARLRMSDVDNFHIRKQMIEAVTAYDEFVKEC